MTATATLLKEPPLPKKYSWVLPDSSAAEISVVRVILNSQYREWGSAPLVDQIATEIGSKLPNTAATVVLPAGFVGDILSQPFTLDAPGMQSLSSMAIQWVAPLFGSIVAQNLKWVLGVDIWENVPSRQASGTRTQTALRVVGGAVRDPVAVKLYPAPGRSERGYICEEQVLGGWILADQTTLQHPPLRRELWSQGDEVALVCQEFAAFNPRPRKPRNPTSRRGIVFAELHRAVAQCSNTSNGGPFVWGLAHFLRRGCSASFGGALRDLGAGSATVVLSTFAPEDELLPIARAYPPLGPMRHRVATLCVH